MIHPACFDAHLSQHLNKGEAGNQGQPDSKADMIDIEKQLDTERPGVIDAPRSTDSMQLVTICQPHRLLLRTQGFGRGSGSDMPNGSMLNLGDGSINDDEVQGHTS